MRSGARGCGSGRSSAGLLGLLGLAGFGAYSRLGKAGGDRRVLARSESHRRAVFPEPRRIGFARVRGGRAHRGADPRAERGRRASGDLAQRCAAVQGHRREPGQHRPCPAGRHSGRGLVDQAGDRLRVSVSLINAANGAEIGSRTLERPREEIFALQDDLAKEVVDLPPAAARPGDRTEAESDRDAGTPRPGSCPAGGEAEPRFRPATGGGGYGRGGPAPCPGRHHPRAGRSPGPQVGQARS